MGIFKGPNITTRANKISSFTVATAEYGAPVMEILGTTRISGNVIYYDDFAAHENRHRNVAADKSETLLLERISTERRIARVKVVAVVNRPLLPIPIP